MLQFCEVVSQGALFLLHGMGSRRSASATRFKSYGLRSTGSSAARESCNSGHRCIGATKENRAEHQVHS
nr:MAG: hypothetical protein DIU78_26740 [Pseudomonadota bacterium]